MTRARLLNGYLDDLASEARLRGAVGKAERENHRSAFLGGEELPGGLWIFAYGSLIWNPAFRFVERFPAVIHGYHRAFCVWSKFARGTPQRPGLTLGLQPGGRCNGVAYLIARERAARETRAIWGREMLTDAYRPAWLTIRVRQRRLRGFTFVTNPDSEYYAGRMPEREQIQTLRRAVGCLGSSTQYVTELIRGLEAQGIGAPSLVRLRNKLLAVDGASA